MFLEVFGRARTMAESRDDGMTNNAKISAAAVMGVAAAAPRMQNR